MQLIRSILTFFLSTIAFVFLLLANLSGTKAPFVRNLHFSRIEDEEFGLFIWTMYNYCSYTGKELTGKGTCSVREAAYPYEPYKFSSGFHHLSTFKYGSKAAYAFILIALLVTIIANIANLLSFFRKSEKLFNVYRISTIVALVSIFLGSTINTALHRNGSSRIAHDGRYKGYMGRSLIAFIWLSVVLQLAAVLVAYLWKTKEQPKDFELQDKKGYPEYPSENTSENPFENSQRRAL